MNKFSIGISFLMFMANSVGFSMANDTVFVPSQDNCGALITANGADTASPRRRVNIRKRLEREKSPTRMNQHERKEQKQMRARIRHQQAVASMSDLVTATPQPLTITFASLPVTK